MEKKDFLNGYKQHVPFMIELEPVEGCNLGCKFCGLRGMREKGTKPWKLMTLETAETIAKMIAAGGPEWEKCRISFCGHGEPTINPQLMDIIKIFKKYCPKNKLYMITNGYGFKHDIFDVQKFVDELAEIGFTELWFDGYSDTGDWTCLKDLQGYDVDILGENKGGLFGNGKKFRIAVFPLDNGNRDWSNHAGAAAPLDFKRLHTTCVKPFRELNLRWDGRINLCCDDFRGQYDAGYLTDFETIDDAWNNPALQAMRILLFNKDRSVKPCLGCSCPAVRAGLLPDPSGKERSVMPETTDEVREFAKSRYVGEKAFGGFVKRKWEKKDGE